VLQWTPMSNRHTAARVSFAAVIAILGLSVSMMTFAQETSSSSSATSSSVESSISSISLQSGFGTVTLEQKNTSERQVFGTWTLLMPGEGQQKGTSENISLTSTPSGSYTLFITAPKGFTTSIRTYHGSTQVDYVQRPQITFTLNDAEDLRVVINYSLTRTGIVSIQSDPPGLDFTLKGPNGLVETGKTPMSFDNTPEGQYSLQFGTLEGCILPPPKSQQLIADGRISFAIRLSCKAADKVRERKEEKSDKYVVVSIDGNDVQLRDVPQSAWFATYIFDVTRRGVLSGYKDAAGSPTGEFGPGNPVTVAELVKIAHRLSGISEESFSGKSPENVHALGQWFSPFIASAENRGWTLYKDATIDPLRSVTRAEVMVTLLQVMDVPLEWQKGDLFDDVTVRTRFASAVETAARDGVVEGLTDEKGVSLHTFNPEGPINRAELSKILNKIFDVYAGKKSSQSSGKS